MSAGEWKFADYWPTKHEDIVNWLCEAENNKDQALCAFCDSSVHKESCWTMNGCSTEDEAQGSHNQVCCLLDDGERCGQPAGNASYSKRIQKTVAQKELKLNIDPNKESCLTMNGCSTEDEAQGSHNQVCCLLDDGERCGQPAGNASYSKRIQKTVAQKELKLNIDPNKESCLTMNGCSTEDEAQGSHNQVCCLLDDGERCGQPAGNASYSKRIQKTVAQKELKLNIDPNKESWLTMNGCSTEDEAQGSHNQVCCLLDDGERCGQPAGNASYSKRIQKTVAQKKLKLNIDPNARHIYICEFHKGVIQNIRSKPKQKDSDDGNGSYDQEFEVPEVDFHQMQVSALRRYKRHYKIQSRSGLNKAQLAETVAQHFKTIPVSEKEAISYFIYMVKNNKNKLDQKSLGESSGN